MPAPPMPVYNVPGLWRMDVHFKQDQQLIQNTHWFSQNDGTVDDAQMAAVAGTYVNWWQTDLQNFVSNTVTLFEIVCKELVPNGRTILYTDELPQQGQHISQVLPNSVTLSVHWGTGRIGRSTHGRTYYIGLCTDQVNANVCTIASDIQTAYDTLRIAYDNFVLNTQFSIVSFVQNNEWRAIPLITPITGVSVDNTIDNQRRRLPGRGR